MLLMWQNGIRHLPVVLAGRLLGIVSNRDLHRALPLHDRTDQTFNDLLITTKVAKIMTPSPVTVTQATTLVAATRAMHERKISSLPVVEHNLLVGVLTTQDMLRALNDRLVWGDAGPPAEETATA